MSSLEIKQKQDKLKEKLISNFRQNKVPGTWCKISTHNGVTDIVKIVATNNNYYSFASMNKNEDTLMPIIYLLHKDEFYIHWLEKDATDNGETLEISMQNENIRLMNEVCLECPSGTYMCDEEDDRIADIVARTF